MNLVFFGQFVVALGKCRPLLFTLQSSTSSVTKTTKPYILVLLDSVNSRYWFVLVISFSDLRFSLKKGDVKSRPSSAYLNIWCQDWFHLNSLPPTIPHTQCPQLNITVMQSKLLINYQSIMSSIQCLDLRSIFCRCFHIITQFLGFLTDSNSTRYTFVLLPIFHQHDIPCYYWTLKWIRRIAHSAISNTF